MSKMFLGMILFLIGASALNAQQQPTLGTMLDDAKYVLNRYEELTSGIACDSWRGATESLKHDCKEELRLIGQNVQSAKVVLRRASSAASPSILDLFIVYEELNEVSGHLYELSCNLGNFAGQDPVPYAQAGAKATVLAAHLAEDIKVRLTIQETKLAKCSTR